MARKKKRLNGWGLALVAVPIFFVVNRVYHVARMPAQATAPIESYFYKTPQQTWETHGALFREYATPIVTAPYLAALAQVESMGNSIATTYWRWRWTLNPFQMYAPASSAAGLFQITDGTYEEAKKLCIKNGKVIETGCWSSYFHSRMSASDATEMTAAYLHKHVERIVGKSRVPARKQRELASVIHLCGKGEGEAHARRGFRFPRGKYCGAHLASEYTGKVERLQGLFAAFERGRVR